MARSRWTKRVMPAPPPPPRWSANIRVSLSLSPSLSSRLNINIGLVPRFSGKPPGNSVRGRAGGDGSDQRSPQKQSSDFSNAHKANSNPAPRSAPALLCALSLPLSRSDERYLKYLAGCSETVWRRRGMQDAGRSIRRKAATRQMRSTFSAESLFPRQPCLDPRRGPSITQMVSTPLLARLAIPMSRRQRHMPPIAKYGQIGKLLREAFSKARRSPSPSPFRPFFGSSLPLMSHLIKINRDRQRGRWSS